MKINKLFTSAIAGILALGSLVSCTVNVPCSNHIDENSDGKCDKCETVMEVKPSDTPSTPTVEPTSTPTLKPTCTEHIDDNFDGKCDNEGCDGKVEWKLNIENKEVTTVYVGKALNLTTKLSPAVKPLIWTSSDESVATVENGAVTGLKEGNATIRVALSDNIYDELAITVKTPIISTEYNATLFDLGGIYQENAVVKSNGIINSFVAFEGEASSHYVASATVNLSNPVTDDTWSRVGISHFNGTNSYYGLQVSPGPNMNARKVVTMVITDGNVQWGTITDRSQIWNQHNMAGLDYSNLKITTVRSGNDFYTYINDELYWLDNGVEGFDNPTLPILNLGSCEAQFSNLSVSYGEESVNTFLASASKPSFYASFDKEEVAADGTIKFTGAADNSCTLNAKDHAAKSIGTSAMLQANVTSTVEFDLKIDSFGGRDGLPALAVTINRYDANCAEARSLVIGQYKAGWTGWNSNGNLNDGIGSGGKEYMANGESTRLEDGGSYHVVFTRVMTDNGQDTKMLITDANGNTLIDDQHGWADGYKGRVVLSFLCRDVDCTISNIVIK